MQEKKDSKKDTRLWNDELETFKERGNTSYKNANHTEKDGSSISSSNDDLIIPRGLLETQNFGKLKEVSTVDVIGQGSAAIDRKNFDSHSSHRKKQRDRLKAQMKLKLPET